MGVSTEGLWVAMIQKARSSVVLGQSLGTARAMTALSAGSDSQATTIVDLLHLYGTHQDKHRRPMSTNDGL